MSDTDTVASRGRDIAQIIKDAGGPSAIAARSLEIADTEKDRITVDAVYKWSKIGIPERNWPLVMPMAQATTDEIHSANLALRQQRVA